MINGSINNVIVSIVLIFISGFISYKYGLRTEQKKQSLKIRGESLDVITEWLKNVEKMVGFMGDTVSSIVYGFPVPVNYNFDERKETSNYLAENSNEVFGILQSKTLQTKQTKKLAEDLNKEIIAIDNIVKKQIMPLENHLLEQANKRGLRQEEIEAVAKAKMEIDMLLKNSYAIISKIKTGMTS